MSARDRLIDELRAHALVVGEVVLTSGRTAQYYVDAKRAILRPAGFRALAELVAERARAWGATAVGGLTMGADAPACAALAGGADVKAFFVRKETKAHGLQQRLVDVGPRLVREPLEEAARALVQLERARLDQQQLLLDPDREAGPAAERMLHSRIVAGRCPTHERD